MEIKKNLSKRLFHTSYLQGHSTAKNANGQYLHTFARYLEHSFYYN